MDKNFYKLYKTVILIRADEYLMFARRFLSKFIDDLDKSNVLYTLTDETKEKYRNISYKLIDLITDSLSCVDEMRDILVKEFMNKQGKDL